MNADLIKVGLCSLCLVFENGAFGEDNTRILLYSEVRRSGQTNEWWLPYARLETLPRWNPAHEEAPVSLSRAIALATNWVVSKEGPGIGYIDEIHIASFHSTAKTFRYVYYYRIIFQARWADYMGCIVLMDGTVLEPEKKPQRPRKTTK